MLQLQDLWTFMSSVVRTWIFCCRDSFVRPPKQQWYPVDQWYPVMLWNGLKWTFEYPTDSNEKTTLSAKGKTYHSPNYDSYGHKFNFDITHPGCIPRRPVCHSASDGAGLLGSHSRTMMSRYLPGRSSGAGIPWPSWLLECSLRDPRWMCGDL